MTALFPVPKIPVSGATAADIDTAAAHVRLLTDLYTSAVKERIEQLNENLCGGRIDASEFFDVLSDISNDLTGRIGARAEREREIF